MEMPPNEGERQRLADALLEYSSTRFGDPTAQPVGFFLRDDEENFCGGLTGDLRWDWLYVEMLWVREDPRGRGHESRLLADGEEFAIASGGIAVHLDTGGDEALSFYEHCGYEVFGTLEGFPPGVRQPFSGSGCGCGNSRAAPGSSR